MGPGNKAICSHMTSHDMANGHTSLVPRPFPLKAERGSGVLSDISCHMGQGVQCKECHIYRLHPRLEFSDDCTVSSLQRLDKAATFLGKAESEL